MILRVHHTQITIPLGKEDDARQFYCGFLGLQEIPKPESLANRGGFWLELGEMQIHVGTENDIDRSKTKAHIAYLVNDLKTWRSKLVEQKLQILDGITIPNYDRFEFRDPFGNRVEFLEKIAQERVSL